MSTIQKFIRRRSRRMASRLVLVLLGGALVLPAFTGSVSAQNIEKVSGAKFNDTVNHIYADKVVGDAAVNAFKSFELDSGRIANMHFATAANAGAAPNLVNFINNQVNISGTVNAVKNNAIGGNLWFLSPNGIVVGASGVINAGGVHLAAPSRSVYDAMVGSDGVKETGFSERWGSVQNGTIALNADAAITVGGKINAVDGASLRAGNVNLKNGADIVSRDSIDYASLVNVEGANAGLTGGLTLAKSKDSGKIVIAAVGDSATTSDWTEVKLAPTVKMEAGATVSSAGDVSVTAEAKNAEAFIRADVSATVNVDGKVTGRNVRIASKARTSS